MLAHWSTLENTNHCVWTPLTDEGVGLILWNNSFNQWYVVTDALQHGENINV